MITRLTAFALLLCVASCQQYHTLPGGESYFEAYPPSPDGVAASTSLNGVQWREGLSFLFSKVMGVFAATRRSDQVAPTTQLLERQTLAGDVTGDINTRISNVRTELKSAVLPAIVSVESDIRADNTNKVILAMANFLGALFGSLKALSGQFNWAAVPDGDKIIFISQVLYGYGYVTPFALEFEEPRLTCGLPDLNAIEPDYAFIDFNPGVDPAIKKYFLTEQANRYKKALYCITSRKGSNLDAKKVSSLIDLHKRLQEDRL